MSRKSDKACKIRIRLETLPREVDVKGVIPWIRIEYILRRISATGATNKR
jgi:hypothetical protein